MTWVLYHQMIRKMIRKFTLAAVPARSSPIAMTLEEDLQSGVTLRCDVGSFVNSRRTASILPGRGSKREGPLINRLS